MTVLGFNAETQKAGSRCQKFSLGVYSVLLQDTLIWIRTSNLSIDRFCLLAFSHITRFTLLLRF